MIDARSGYYKVKLDKKSLYLAMFACQFGRHRFSRLPFRMAPAGDMFYQKKIIEISTNVLNVFGIANYILIVGYDADRRDHQRTQDK